MDEESDNFYAIVSVENSENEASEDTAIRVPDPIVVKGSGHITV